MKISRNYKGIDLLRSQGLLDEIKHINFRCKHCANPHPEEHITVSDGFWVCLTCDRKNKYNLAYKEDEIVYSVDYKKLIKAVIKRIKSFGLKISTVNEYFLIENGSYKAPLLFLDFTKNTTMLIDLLDQPSIILYIRDENQKDVVTIYNKPNFIRVTEFFDISKEEFCNMVERSNINLETTKIFNIEKKVNYFIGQKSWFDFEREMVYFFDSLKFKEEQLKRMLNFFKKNCSNPTGTKFVHIGGNYTSDFYPIMLSDYVNELLKVEKDKTYEAKCYTNSISKEVFDKKIRTNIGRKLVFVTNKSQSSIPQKVWESLIKAKENHGGEWYYFIMDFELIVLFLYFIGIENYFNV